MITCQVCGKLFKNINRRHLAQHGLTREEYTARFPDAPLQSPESAEKRRLAAERREAGMSEETKRRKAAAIAEKKSGQSSWNAGKSGYKLDWSPEARQRIAERGAHNKGVPASEQQRQKQSAAMKQLYASGELVHWNLGNRTPDEVRRKISEACAGLELTQEQRERHLEAIRLWVASPDYINPFRNAKLTEQHRDRVSAGVKQSQSKIRKSMEEAGHWLPLSEIPEVVKYRRRVWALTNSNTHLIEGYDESKRGLCSKTQDTWQVDHRVSIMQGWLDGATPEELAHPVNLRFVPWRENLAKWHRSELTLEQLRAEIATTK